MFKKKIFTMLVLLMVAAFVLSACGSASSAPQPGSAQPSSNSSASSASQGADTDGDGVPDNAEAVLATDPNNPDTDGDGPNDLDDANPIFCENPIKESSTTQGFTIDSILVENNVFADGQIAPDHLELKVTNTSGADLINFDMYYTMKDLSTNDVQAYYMSLAGLTIKPGESVNLHFDNSGVPGHFGVNPNSMYFTSTNERFVEVTLHAQGFAPETANVKKDAGNEVAD